MSVSIPGAIGLVNPVELADVLDALRAMDAPSLRLAAPPQRLGGGFWAEMWTLQLDSQGPHLPDRVVLRLAPDAVLAAWETAVQRGVADQGYPTPAIIASAGATDTTRFWSVMRYAAGQPLLAGLSGVSALARLPRLARDLPDQLAEVTARLHALDPVPVERELADITGRRIGVDGLLEHFAACAAAVRDPALARSVDRLAATRPPPDRLVLCHGDLHPFNVLRHGGELTVLDWTGAQIADPAYDVAFTRLLIAHSPLAAPRPARPVIRAAARALARRFVRSYDAAADHRIDVAQLRWHTALHSTRVLLDIAQWRADGSLDAHRGHPWLAMEAELSRRS